MPVVVHHAVRASVGYPSQQSDLLLGQGRALRHARLPIACRLGTRFCSTHRSRTGGLGPEALRGVVKTLISILRERQPDIQWHAEYDLEQVPLEAECFQPGEVLRRMWDGTGPLPKTYRVVAGADGRRMVKRCLVEGDDESDRFSAAYERQLRIVDECWPRARRRTSRARNITPAGR